MFRTNRDTVLTAKTNLCLDAIVGLEVIVSVTLASYVAELWLEPG